jgi:hypothetical protein
MDAATREQSTRPLGVIGCLTVGFEVLSQNLGLMVLPVLLDLLLWLGPQLSVALLVRQFDALMMMQPVPDPATARQVEQAAQLLKLFGEQFNLLSLLSVLPLLNVPSLLAQRVPGILSPLGESPVLWVKNGFALIGWGMVLVPVGLVLGFIYLNSMARRVRAMRALDGQKLAPDGRRGALGVDRKSAVEGPFPSADRKSTVAGRVPSAGATSVAEGPVLSAGGEPTVEGIEQSAREISGTGKFLRVFLFALGLLMAAMALAPLWMLLVGALLTVAQPLGVMVWALSIGFVGYVALHLLFVVPGVLLGGRGLLRAIWESIILMHTQFPAVVGLVVLVVVIYQGLGYVWSLPVADSWSLLVGILGNSCIGTGLTAATFVFYQERVPAVADGRR